MHGRRVAGLGSERTGGAGHRSVRGKLHALAHGRARRRRELRLGLGLRLRVLRVGRRGLGASRLEHGVELGALGLRGAAGMRPGPRKVSVLVSSRGWRGARVSYRGLKAHRRVSSEAEGVAGHLTRVAQRVGHPRGARTLGLDAEVRHGARPIYAGGDKQKILKFKKAGQKVPHAGVGQFGAVVQATGLSSATRPKVLPTAWS